MALKATDQWWVVLLTSIAFNLPYGPWEGSAWYNRMREAAADLVAKTPSSDFLFSALYGPMCRDAGGEPSQDPAAKLLKLQELCQSEGFLKKGPRTALRRWFSWLQSATWHQQVWHSRLLTLIYAGVACGVYKTLEDCPYWSGGVSDCKAPEPEEREQEAKEREEAAKVPQVAAGSGSSGSKEQAGGATAETKAGGVKHGEDEIQALRKKCRNTMYVATAILSMPGLQGHVALITAFCQPIYNAHSRHASEARGPQEVLAYYLAQS
eukprot:5987892-Lingulodinium_polyedra.AAC.1